MLPSRMKLAPQLAQFRSPAPLSLVFASTLATQRLLALSLEGLALFALSLEGCVVFCCVKAFVFIDLPSLGHHKNSSDPLFSVHCSLFLQNDRGGVCHCEWLCGNFTTHCPLPTAHSLRSPLNRINNLRTLLHIAQQPNPMQSATCALFAQNTGVGVSPFARH